MDTPPLPDLPPERIPAKGDERWKRLDAHQRADVERCLRLVLLLEEAVATAGSVAGAMPLVRQRAAELGLAPAAARDGKKVRRTGLSRNSFYRMAKILKDPAWSWATVARYQKLIKDKAGALREVDLDAARVEFFLRQHGGLAAWCRAKQIPAMQVRELIAPNRAGKHSTQAAKLLRAAIAEYRKSVAMNLAQARTAQAQLTDRIRKLEYTAARLD